MLKRRDIEGIRALAVLAVLLFHAGVPGMDGGYIGVDVFFVVSGFLITTLLVRERADSGRISLSAFYSRRIRRLLPVSALVALVTLVAAWLWLEPLRVKNMATDVIGVATFSTNFVFANRGADYLQSSLPPSPLQHYWSLAVEEQFYVVWPLLLVLVTVGARAAGMIRLRVGVMASLVAIGSFVACMMTMDVSQPWAFFSPHTRAFELALGALVAVLPTTTRRIDVVASATTAWIGLAAIVWSVVTFDENTAFPGPWALVPVLATVVLLRGGDVTQWSPVALLKIAPLQWLGSRSYSAYLWHWPLLIVGAAALERELSVWDGLAFTAVALALSEFSYRWPENAVRHDVGLRGLRAGVFAVALTSMVAGAGLLARENPPVRTSGVNAAAPTLTATTVNATTDASNSTMSLAPTTTLPVAPVLPRPSRPIEAIVQAATTTGLPSNLEPGLNQVYADMPTIYANNCHAGFGAVTPKKCIFGDETSNVVVGLYGDSHAAQWFPLFEKIAIKRKWKLITYTKRGCPPAEIEVYSSVLGKVYTQCGPWRKAVLDQMVQDGVKVVLVAHFDRLLSAATKIPPWQKEWREGLRGTFDALESRGIVPVLMEDTPWPGQDVPTCLSKNYTNVGACSQPVTQAYRDDMKEIREDFQTEGKHVLWVRHLFCTDTVCPNIVGNLLVYRDDNHITVTYASFIAPLIDEILAPFVDWYTNPS